MSGRDVRRLLARASTTTPETKRDQIARAVIGAAAAGAERILLGRDPFRIAEAAVQNLPVPVPVELLPLPMTHRASDTTAAARIFEREGCGAMIALGGDGTGRAVVQSGVDLPLLPLSTGTNNVFPVREEATVAGAAAALIASGAVEAGETCLRAKLVRIEIEGEAPDLAVVDAAHLVGDHPGSLLPVDPDHLRTVVFARAEPASIGLSPIGGLLEPSGAADDFGVVVQCGPDGDTLLAPLSAGLYREVSVQGAKRLELGKRVSIEGPGLLAFDGDRARNLEPGQRVHLRVERDGPPLIDVAATLAAAARSGRFLRLPHWHDSGDGGQGPGCC